MVNILQFADVVNRNDFIDTLVKYVNQQKFNMSVCVRSEKHNIAAPQFSSETKYKLLSGNSHKDLIQTAWKLSRILKEWNIDILHAHHFNQAIIGWLATKLHPKTKLVIGRHYSDSIYRLPDGIKPKTLLKLEQITNEHAARIIAPSQFIFNILTDRQNINPDKIDVVSYGFVPEKYNLIEKKADEKIRSEFNLDGKFVICNFSRLHEEKGHCYLLEAIAKISETIPNVLVLIVGEGAERKNLEKQIENLGLNKNIKLVGWRKDAMSIMSVADVVVQSTLQEAFSQVMVETLWMSKPLIITDVSGAADIIDNGENGIIVQKADADALAIAIEKLFRNPNLADKLSQNGRKYVEENLIIDKKIKEYENSFLKVVD